MQFHARQPLQVGRVEIDGDAAIGQRGVGPAHQGIGLDVEHLAALAAAGGLRLASLAVEYVAAIAERASDLCHAHPIAC